MTEVTFVFKNSIQNLSSTNDSNYRITRGVLFYKYSVSSQKPVNSNSRIIRDTKTRAPTSSTVEYYVADNIEFESLLLYDYENFRMCSISTVHSILIFFRLLFHNIDPAKITLLT